MDELVELVTLARGGDEDAYQRIVQRFSDMALSYAFSIVGDRDLAEDARQEAFLNAYVDLVALREPAAFPGWFRTVVRKHAVQIIRGRGRLMVPIEDVPEASDGKSGPDATAVDFETDEMVRAAIDRLPDNEAEVVRLYYLEELSLREIGKRLQIPAKTVKSRLHTARSHLRLRLGRLARREMARNRPQDRPEILRQASAEAVDLLRRRRQHLLHTPGEEDVMEAGDMACAEGRILRFMGRLEEAMVRFHEGLSIPKLKSHPIYRARFRTEIGLTRVQEGRYDAARKELKAARIGLRRAKAAPSGRAGVCLEATMDNALGMCDWSQGDFAGARKWYERALDAACDCGCDELRPQLRNNLALLDWKAGDLHGAREHLRAALKEWRALKDRFGEVLTGMNLGIVEENLGQAAAARRRYARTVDVAREIRFAQAEGAACANLSNLELTTGEPDRALSHAREARRIAAEIADRRSEAIALENEGLAHLALEDAEAAQAAWETASKHARVLGDRERRTSLTLCRAQADVAQGDTTTAKRRLAAAEKSVEEQGYLELRPWLRTLRGRVAAMDGDTEEASLCLTDALREATRQRRSGEARRVREVARDLGVRLPRLPAVARSRARKR